MKFTQIPATTFQHMQLNAGILLTSFDPNSPTVTNSNIFGATSGGNTFSATPTFRDDGEDIDNCPKNMMELKRLESWEVKMAGTFITVDSVLARNLFGAADVTGETSEPQKIVPRNDLAVTDFNDIWWVGDYSGENNDTAGGFVAIKLKNALSTGGFQVKSGDKSKGQLAYEFTGHYSMQAQNTVPCEVYIQQGSAASGAGTGGQGDTP